MLRVVCANPRCQKVLRIRVSQAGTRIRCPACRAELIAPQVTGDLPAGAFDGLDVDAAEMPRPAWAGCAFYLGILGGLFATLGLASAFEVWLFLDSQAVNEGPVAGALTAGTWKVAGPKGKAKERPLWLAKDSVWTFHNNGCAETGQLMAGRNRYERKAARGFRNWKWTASDKELTLTPADKDKEQTIAFTVVVQGEDKLALFPAKQAVSEKEDDNPDAEVNKPAVMLLALEKVAAVDTFPGWRVVFYGGVLAPMLVALLLSWLISREVFHNGCLRFALSWPLTVLLGLALGAGAGYLMDMLNEYSQVPLAAWTPAELSYWMLLSFAQGVVCLLMGFWLALLSCLRPT
jgi:hypothetical protein